MKQGKHSARKPPKLIILQKCKIIPSQMEVQHRNVALLDPQGTHRTQTLKEHLETRKFRKQIKKIKDRRAYAERTVRTLAFAPSALRPLCYVMLSCDYLPKVATRSQNLQQKYAAKQPKIAKISHKWPKVALKCQKSPKTAKQLPKVAKKAAKSCQNQPKLAKRSQQQPKVAKRSLKEPKVIKSSQK